MKLKSIPRLLPGRKEVPETVDTSGWDNSGDIAEANSAQDYAYGYNAALDELAEREVEIDRMEECFDWFILIMVELVILAIVLRFCWWILTGKHD